MYLTGVNRLTKPNERHTAIPDVLDPVEFELIITTKSQKICIKYIL
jgi:hypothetical protein